MSNTPALQTSTWQLAISPSRYKRTPLTPKERSTLKVAVHFGERSKGINGGDYAREELQRFQEPIYAVMALRIKDLTICQRVRRILYLQMIERGTTFWEWTMVALDQITSLTKPTPGV